MKTFMCNVLHVMPRKEMILQLIGGSFVRIRSLL